MALNLLHNYSLLYVSIVVAVERSGLRKIRVYPLRLYSADEMSHRQNEVYDPIDEDIPHLPRRESHWEGESDRSGGLRISLENR